MWFLFLQSPTQDHAAKEKAIQTMSSMSSAQIVSATAIHNKAAAAGLASLGLTSPVTYPTAVIAPPFTLQPTTRLSPSASECFAR